MVTLWWFDGGVAHSGEGGHVLAKCHGSADELTRVFFFFRKVCEEQSCEDIVFPCAMNYVDRFLARTDVKKSQLQLLGAVCLLIASKMRTSRPLALEALVYYTDYSVTAEELKVSFAQLLLP